MLQCAEVLKSGRLSLGIFYAGVKALFFSVLQFFFLFFAGANLPISENWDLSATVMAQAYDNGLTSVSGSVGLRYAF